jgi:phosphoribosylglycinamide formyltransferase-1
MKIFRLGLLASHRGTNMQSIIDACRQGRLRAVPAVVISNNGESAALDRAAMEGIPAYHLGSRNFPDADLLDRTMRDTLQKHDVDLVVLAGFMKKIGPATLKAFGGRILNIHPALLPKYGGKGMYGARVHEQVLASGDTETGVTIHVVTGEYDAGAILAQRRVPVYKNDTVDSLAERTLAVEHELYVETLADIIAGKIKLAGP